MSPLDEAQAPLDSTYLQTEFLERVAHELRGPVGVTSGALDEIELALGPDAEKLGPYFLMARRGMRRVLRVAERLQRTAQLEEGTIEWAKAPTDLRPLAEQATKETVLLEARRSVHVNVSCSEEACLASVDAAWMHVAIAEIVGNAIRFARSAITVHTAASEGEVTVTISDDGPGFSGPPGRRFEPPSDKRGVGLSLSLVHDVIAAHGGRIELHGPRESGTTTALSGATVIVTLPRLKKSER